MKYLSIRKLHYKTQRKKHKEIDADLDDWIFSPYHCLKARFFIELSAMLVSILQYTSIKPNFITILLVLTSILGGVLLSSGEQNLIIAGVIIFFTYGLFDWIDGLLARVKNCLSTLGGMLDDWAGYVSSFSFPVGLGVYLFNATQEIHFIYLVILLIIVKALDIKNYTYHYLMYNFYKKNKIISKKAKKNKLISNEFGVSKNLIRIKNFFQGLLYDRAIVTDSICVVILIEVFYGQIYLTNFIYYLIFLKTITLFSGGFYLVYFKSFADRINSKLN